MPQLSPLNWLFLFLLFWFMILLVLSLVWWYSSVSYKLSNIASEAVLKDVENKWSW